MTAALLEEQSNFSAVSRLVLKGFSWN